MGIPMCSSMLFSLARMFATDTKFHIMFAPSRLGKMLYAGSIQAVGILSYIVFVFLTLLDSVVVACIPRVYLSNAYTLFFAFLFDSLTSKIGKVLQFP